jgi:hypothetical protein
MAQTNWTGPLASGDRPAGFPGGSNVGFVVLSQSTVINVDNTLVQNATLRVPRGTQIIDFKIDCRTVFNAGTSAVLSAGTTSGGTQYLSGINMATVGRKALGLTAAQMDALQNVLNDRDVVFTITSTGTQPSTGVAYIEMQYVQKTADD